MEDIDDKGLIPETEMISAMWEGKDKAPVTAIPAISVHQGQIRINCATPGASIGYKIIKDGIEGKSWDVYSTPIELKNNEALIYQAHRIGYEPSQVQEYIK